jgi:hypothetical protein
MEQVGWSDIAHNIASFGCHNLDDRHTTSIYHESVQTCNSSWLYFLVVLHRCFIMANIGSYLRGHAGNDSVNNLLSSFIDRNLQEEESDPSVLSASSSPKNNESFLLLTAGIVGLVMIVYVLCIYQAICVWLCRVCCGRQPEVEEPGETVLIHEGITFNLSSNQRRAVLEAILKENSKVRSFNRSLAFSER